MIEVGDEVETPTGHIGIVQSHTFSLSVQKWDGLKAVTNCQVLITDNEEWSRTPSPGAGSTVTVTDNNGNVTSKIEWHGSENLKPAVSEYTQAINLLGEDYFA